MVSVAAIKFWDYSAQVATDNTETHEYDCVPIKVYLHNSQRHKLGLWAIGCWPLSSVILKNFETFELSKKDSLKLPIPGIRSEIQ